MGIGVLADGLQQQKDAFLVVSYLYRRSTIACLWMNGHGVCKSFQ